MLRPKLILCLYKGVAIVSERTTAELIRHAPQSGNRGLRGFSLGCSEISEFLQKIYTLVVNVSGTAITTLY